MHLVPAYGRDYTSVKAVKEAFKKGEDFLIQDIGSRWDGKYCNIHDLTKDGVHTVYIRYKRLTQVAVVKF